jgi:hypothetical protein
MTTANAQAARTMPILDKPTVGSIAHLVETFASKSFRVEGDRITYFHGYSDSDVLGVLNNAQNWLSAAVNGLEFAADAMSAHNDGVKEFCRESASWLVQHLTEEVEKAHYFEVVAITELARRGYDEHGKPLR